jgi:hypothetical protein
MFHNIPDPMRQRIACLEVIDRRDRVDGTPRSKRLRQQYRKLWILKSAKILSDISYFNASTAVLSMTSPFL